MKHKFVEFIPKILEEGTVYVSMEFGTAVHKCCCGCGNEVVTPLTPTDWQLTYDGESISLDPSIGNWSFPCQSHYFIKRNQVVWAKKWTKSQIEAGRKYDRILKEQYFEDQHSKPEALPSISKPLWRKVEACFQKLKALFSKQY